MYVVNIRHQPEQLVQMVSLKDSEIIEVHVSFDCFKSFDRPVPEQPISLQKPIDACEDTQQPLVFLIELDFSQLRLQAGLLLLSLDNGCH
jgi:hypothetical protein